MNTKKAYKQQLEAQLEELDAQLNLLAAKAERDAADTKVKVAQELDLLREKQHQAAKKLEELEAASDHAWNKVRDSADILWHDLKTSVASTVSKFKDR